MSAFDNNDEEKSDSQLISEMKCKYQLLLLFKNYNYKLNINFLL